MDNANFWTDERRAILEKYQLNNTKMKDTPVGLKPLPRNQDQAPQSLDIAAQIAALTISEDGETSSSINFRKWPLEVQAQMLLHLDLRSLLNIRVTNSKLKANIDDLPAFKRLFTHIPDVVRVMHDTKTLQFHTLNDLDCALRSDACVVCGELAPCLSLMTCDRCCLNCLETEDRFRLIPQGSIRSYFNLNDQQIADISSMEIDFQCAESLVLTPLTLGFRDNHFDDNGMKLRKIQLWPYTQILARAIECHGEEGLKVILESYGRFLAENHNLEPYRSVLHDPRNFSDPIRGEVVGKPLYQVFPKLMDQPILLKYTTPLEYWRHMGVIYIPTYNTSTEKIEDTFRCHGCVYTAYKCDPDLHWYHTDAVNGLPPVLRKRNRAWKKDGLLEHIDGCVGMMEEVQDPALYEEPLMNILRPQVGL